MKTSCLVTKLIRLTVTDKGKCLSISKVYLEGKNKGWTNWHFYSGDKIQWSCSKSSMKLLTCL